MSDNETEDLKRFIKEETESARKNTRTTYILGTIAAVLIGGYLGFILHMEKTFLNPDNLAYLIRIQAESAIPGLILKTENALVEQAEEGSQQLSDKFLELVPQITATGMEQIDLAYTEQIPYLSEEFSKIVADYIHLHGPELAAFAKENTSQEFADHFTREMMAEFNRQLDVHLADNYEGRSLAYFKENMTHSIVAMNQTVEEMIEQNPEDMDRKARLQRRLLAGLVTLALKEQETH